MALSPVEDASWARLSAGKLFKSPYFFLVSNKVSVSNGEIFYFADFNDLFVINEFRNRDGKPKNRSKAWIF